MRSVLLVANTSRRAICDQATQAAVRLADAGLSVRMLADEACHVSGTKGINLVVPDGAADGADAVLVLGGDGTFLRAAELARPAGVPMVGVNLGHVGFLAEAEPNALADTVDAIAEGDYAVDERVTVEADIIVDGVVLRREWALNEVSLDRTNRIRMLEISISVDERPLQSFGCDGVLCSTPTGSTAYAFSAGGPIVWPDVDALLIVPNAAHALFARPLVVAPTSVVDIDMRSRGHHAVLSSDGRRSTAVPPHARVRIRRGTLPVRIARIAGWNFADRLVSKFQLPVRSLREASPPADPAAE